MAKFVKRCIKAGFLLGCVFLLLVAAQGETDSQPDGQGNRIFQIGEADPDVSLSVDSSDWESADISTVEGEQELTLEAPYAQAYYTFLKECIFSGGTPISITNGISTGIWDMRFELVFIDKDDIPELLIFLDDCHAAGVEVYTYIDDQVAELGEFGSFGKMQYVKRSGMIFDHFMGQGEAHTYFFRMEGGEARQVSHLHSWPDNSRYLETGEYMEFYEIDERSVTEDVYQAKWEELYDSQEYVLIGYEDGIPLDETELLPTLAQAIENLLWKRDSQPVLEQVAELSEVLEAYGDFLAENACESESFTLIYLDNDDIPELVRMHDGGRLAGAEIYTFKQGKPVCVGEYGQWGWTWYLEKEGIIFHPYDHQGIGGCSVHRIEGTEDTLLQVFDYVPDVPTTDLDEWDGDSFIYKVDGEVVSEEQYEEAWQKWDSPDERKLGYEYCIPMEGMNIPMALAERLQTLILTRYDTLRKNVLIKSGLDEEAILFMDYDDYDGDGIYEAFVFCGESYDDYYGEINYSGDFWFVGADQCMRLPERFGSRSYRKIDGLMMLGYEQKYLYYYSDYCVTANISGIWTVENGKPVEVDLPQTGQVLYRGDPYGFELWVDSYNNFYEPDGDLWTGHTWRPYFYHYDSQAGQLTPDDSQNLSPKELEEICGFDLAGEVEAEGYDVTAIVRWQPSDIVTINYTIPPDEEDPFHTITYENIIWDCLARDYWRSKERGVSSWQNAGVGGSI